MQYVARCTFGAALVALCTPALATWQVSHSVDPMTDKATTSASISAGSATLQLACLPTFPRLIFDVPVALHTVGLSYRFDDGPVVPRVAVVGSDFRTVYPWPAAKSATLATIAHSRRLRVQIFPTGSAPQFFDFDLTGSREVVRQLGCR